MIRICQLYVALFLQTNDTKSILGLWTHSLMWGLLFCYVEIKTHPVDIRKEFVKTSNFLKRIFLLFRLRLGLISRKSASSKLCSFRFHLMSLYIPSSILNSSVLPIPSNDFALFLSARPAIIRAMTGHKGSYNINYWFGHEYWYS